MLGHDNSVAGVGRATRAGSWRRRVASSWPDSLISEGLSFSERIEAEDTLTPLNSFQKTHFFGEVGGSLGR